MKMYQIIKYTFITSFCNVHPYLQAFYGAGIYEKYTVLETINNVSFSMEKLYIFGKLYVYLNFKFMLHNLVSCYQSF